MASSSKQVRTGRSIFVTFQRHILSHVAAPLAFLVTQSLEIQQKAVSRPPTPPPLSSSLPPLLFVLVRKWSCMITADTLPEVYFM